MPDIPDNWNKVHETFHIFDCIPPWIAWQQSARSQSLPRDVNAGMNFSIILGAVCYIEGSLERHLLKRVDAAEKHDDKFIGRLLDNLRITVSATTGSEGYDQLFELVTGTRANAIISDPQLWEAVKVLFHFRNVIGHGRAVGYHLYFPPGIGGIWEVEFSGGYRKVEDYLIKKGLLETHHIEEADNWLYLTDNIADHFWDCAQKFIAKIVTV